MKAMENEPEKPQSSVPSPDLPPPPPPSAMPPPPDLPPPPPPVAEPKPAPLPKQEPAKIDPFDGDAVPPPGTEAAFDNRIIAAIIDSFVAAGLYIIVGVLSNFLGALVYIAYFLVRDALPFLDGQSVGKKLMKIRAVEQNGAKLTNNWKASVIRNISLAIPFFGLVEAYILYQKKEKAEPLIRLGDEWAKTKVIAVGGPSGI